MSESLDAGSIARRFSQSAAQEAGRVPKYLLLSNALLDAIESGEFKPGSQIPGERDLSSILPLSLGTIQKAMNDLVDQGVVFRRAGMGTFVTGAAPATGRLDEDKVARRDLVHFRFLDDNSRELLPVYLHVESIERVPRTSGKQALPWERFLEDGQSFVRIDRILKVDTLFTGFCRFYLPFEHFGSLLKCTCEELSGITLREFLNKTYLMPTLRFEHRITTDLLPDAVCDKLKTDKGAYGTVWHIFGRSYRNAPASFQLVYLPAGHRPIELLEKLE